MAERALGRRKESQRARAVSPRSPRIEGEWRSERWEGASKARGREQFHREALEYRVNGGASAGRREQSQRAKAACRVALKCRGVSSTVKLSVSKTELGGSNPSAPARFAVARAVER